MLYTLLLLIHLASPQLTEAGQAKLERMVQERDLLHEQWKNAESKKSGIFGNRTKKDMVETNEWLQRIVAKDNQIMDELRLIGDIETTVISQEKDDYRSITAKQEQDIIKLRRALQERDKSLEEGLKNRRTFEWISFILFLVSGSLGYWIYRTRFKH